MKREQLLRLLRAEARERGLDYELDKAAGKGSHYRLRLGKRISTVQSGELTSFHVKRIRKDLGLD